MEICFCSDRALGQVCSFISLSWSMFMDKESFCRQWRVTTISKSRKYTFPKEDYFFQYHRRINYRRTVTNTSIHSRHDWKNVLREITKNFSLINSLVINRSWVTLVIWQLADFAGVCFVCPAMTRMKLIILDDSL